MSAADILAAARNKPAAAAPETKAAPIPGPSAPAQTTPKKLSPAEILAMAKGGKQPGVVPPAPPAAAPAAVNPPAVKPAPEPEPEPAAEAPAHSSGGATKSMLGKFKTNDEIIAYLRKGK
jgi:DamX protein